MKHWLLHDLDLGCRFKAKRRYLNLGEVCPTYLSGSRPELDFLRNPAIDTYAEDGVPPEFAQYFLLFESIFRDVAVTHKWNARMLQVSSIGKAMASRPEDWNAFFQAANGN